MTPKTSGPKGQTPTESAKAVEVLRVWRDRASDTGMIPPVRAAYGICADEMERALRESDGGGEVVPAEVWALVCSGGEWWERLERERTFRVGDFGNTAATATENCIRDIRIAIQKAAAPAAVDGELADAMFAARGFALNVRDQERRRITTPGHTSSSVVECERWLDTFERLLFTLADAAGNDKPRPWRELENAPEPAPPLADSSVADRAAAEQAYTLSAFDYCNAPVGSRDWVLYWNGWQAALRSAAPAGMVLVNEAQLVAITEGLDEHPDDWDGPCMCADCRSYAVEDAQ